MSRRTQLIAELESCKDKSGRITRAAVVTKARNKRQAPTLWEDFRRKGLWNDKKAAEVARLDYAGSLITRYLTVVVVNKSTKITSVGYVKDPVVGHNVPGYRKLDDLDHKGAELAVAQEIASCEATIRRARSIAGVLDVRFPGLSEYLETALEALIAARNELRKAA